MKPLPTLPSRATLTCLASVVGLSILIWGPPAEAQVKSAATGQSVALAYEGWEQNDDGSFSLLFGYMNRNWLEELDIPIGSDNRIEPGGPDRGQPTHFLPRRNRHVFSIRVPEDFGDKEVVWTLASHGETTSAYGTLHPDYFLDDIAIMNNNGAGGPAGGMFNIFGNERPMLKVEGDAAVRATVGQPVTLSARVTDDGVPMPRAMPPLVPGTTRSGGGTPNSASGLRVAWFVYRGPGDVAFDPPQFEVWENFREGANSPWASGWKTPEAPEDSHWVVRATFNNPGTYVLRCQAHDGGLATHEDVTVTVSSN